MTVARRRTLLLAALLSAYAAAGVRPAIGDALRRGRFDPWLPAARALEQRIEEARFADALPLAQELDRVYPREPQIAWWLARVHHGLHDPRREAAAWEAYVDTSAAPDDACPALADAYAQAGRAPDALHAYERCVQFAPEDPEARIDLGEAYARAGRQSDAQAAFDAAARLDPANPVAVRRLQAMRGSSP